MPPTPSASCAACSRSSRPRRPSTPRSHGTRLVAIDGRRALHTIGYEVLPPDELVAELVAAGVERLIDVRYRPQSRRAGMSKTKLGLHLAAHGIAYEHRRSLGTPPDIRVHFKAGRTAQARRAFAAHVEATAAEELDDLAEELRDGPVTALLCLEAEPAQCHRRVLAEALVARRPDLVVVDL